jgi:prepilin-type N-terminal cleavage/methylation domain-containing protein
VTCDSDDFLAEFSAVGRIVRADRRVRGVIMRGNKGFTLVELLVVIAIIGVLVALL